VAEGGSTVRAQRLSGGLALPQVKRLVARWLDGPALSPRLALLAVGTLLQTVALTASLSVDMGQGASPAALLVVVPFALAIAAFVVAICFPVLSAPLAGMRALAYRLATSVLLVGVGLGVLFTAAIVIELAPSGMDPRSYGSDAAAFNHYNADLVLAGRNPYTADDRFWDALARFPLSAATPLQRGRYADLLWAPSFAVLRRDVQREISNPALRGPEFARSSLHSYPALAFLVYVPGIWAGAATTLPVTLAALMLFLVAIGRALPAHARVVGWTLLLANTPGILLALRGAFDVLALLLALLAWQLLPRRWLSPALLGLSCAVKQLAWPLAPLYLVLCVRQEGWRRAAMRAGVLLAAFLAPNLPFVVLAPQAWAKSMLLPVMLPTFPDGIGLIAFAHAGVLPLWPAWVYTVIELLAFGAIALWLIVARRTPRPELVLLLGTLPLALGWRSLASYFAWLPAIALFTVIPALQADSEHAASGVMLVRSVSAALAQSE
jgi:hypothetical protein